MQESVLCRPCSDAECEHCDVEGPGGCDEDKVPGVLATSEIAGMPGDVPFPTGKYLRPVVAATRYAKIGVRLLHQPHACHRCWDLAKTA